MPLFAEVPDWIPFLSTTLGGVAVWAATYYSSQHKVRREERKEDEKGIVEHQSELIDRLTAEMTELRDRSERQGERLTKAIAHMMYLEGIMESQGIKFRPFGSDPSGGTGLHEALKQDE